MLIHQSEILYYLFFHYHKHRDGIKVSSKVHWPIIQPTEDPKYFFVVKKEISVDISKYV